MRKIIFYLLLFISTVSFGQTTIANKLKITAAIKDNLASRVMVQDSLTGELKWVLKNSLGTVKSVTGTSGVTVALGTSTPVIGLGAITPTSTNGVSATTMAYNDATSSIQTQLNGKQPVGTYATGTGSATGTNTGDNAVNTLYSGLVSNATHTGEVTGATTLTITPKAVTLAKMNDVATGTVFYRKTAATGTPEVQTLATLKTDLGLTGTNSGDQTTVSGNAGTATTLQTGRTIAITGDLAYTSPTFNGSANVTATGTLATVNANVGSFTNASVTVNAKGLVTAASSGPTPQAALSGTGLVRSTAGAITYDTNAYITTVNGTAITPSSTNGVSAATMAFNDATSSIQTQLNGKQPSGTYATGTGTASGTNTGDNAVNSLYSGLVTNATHTGDATGATALTVKGINGTLLSTLGTGILKNTTTTGVPSIAVAADFPTLNQNTTGTASNITGVYGGTITSSQVTTGLGFTPQAALTNPITGTGTTNYLSKFTGTSALGNSIIQDNGTQIGIGYTPSAWVAGRNALQIGSYTSLYTNSSLGSSELLGNAYMSTSSIYNYTNANYATLYQQYDGSHRWLYAPSGTAGGAITFTEGMRISNGGNVGIATPSPDNGKLTILKNTSFATESSYGIAIQSNTANVYTELLFGADDTVDCGIIQTAGKNTSFTSKKLSLQPNGGPVLLGTTTDDGINKLQVNGSGKFNGNLELKGAGNIEHYLNSGTSSNSNIFFQENSVTKYISGYVPSISAFRFSNGSTDVLTLKNTGVINISSLAGTGTRTVVADATGNLSTTSTSNPNYKVYTALLSQSGTSAPTATVLENTLGGTVVWTRNTNGSYIGTLAEVFTLNKTAVLISCIGTSYISSFRSSVNTITVNTYVTSGGAADDRLFGNTIEIRVYN